MLPTLRSSRIGRSRSPALGTWRSDPALRLFEEFFGSDPLRVDAGLVPAVDVDETPDAIELTAEMPGLSAEDFDLTVENGVLTISGEKSTRRETGDEGARRHLTERTYGRFSRSFRLPNTVDADAAEAHYESGLLTVRLPKTGTATGRTIEVTSGS